MGIRDASDPMFHYGKSATANAKPFNGIVWHHTRDAPLMNMVNYGKTVDQQRGGAFGYHYYIGPDGEVVQGAPEDKRTNHIKPGSPTGFNNSNAIGISLVGAEHGATRAQDEAAKRLGKEIEAKYRIPPSHNMGHGELQNDRQHHEGGLLAGYMRGDDVANDTMRALGKPAFQPDPPTAVPGQPTTLSSRSRVTGGASTGSAIGGPAQDNLRGAPAMQDQERQHLLFKNMKPNRRDRMILALQGMTMNPNEGLMGMARDNIQERRGAERDARQRTVTAEWLAQQPGGAEYAQAINSGALPATQGLQMWQAQIKGQGPEKGVSINGQLVNPTTGQVIGDYRTPDGGSENDRTIARIKSAYGVDDQTAVGIVDGVLRVSRDPYDQSVIVTNLATGQSYSPQAQQSPQSHPMQIPDVSAIQQTELPPAPDASNAFGFEGMVKGAINSATDFAGMSAPFDGVQQSQSDFAVLREGLVNDISQGYGRQPPSWLLKNIQDLTPQAGGLMGPEAAQAKLAALQRSFQTELSGIQGQIDTRISPQQRQVLSERGAALQSALGRVSSALGLFGQGGGGGTTRGGVQWRIEQ
jgi:hypothetical protein